MDEQSNYIPVKQTGSILNIKPIEELEKVEPKEEPEPEQDAYDDMEPELEDLKKDEIFVKPEKPKKKKRVLSERQKAHMARLNQLRIERLAKKKQEKEAKEAKRKPKPVKAAPPVKTPPPVHTPRPKQAQAPSFDLNQANQAYMKQFFDNMNMFMESYNKLNTLKQKQARPNAPTQTIRKTINKTVKPKPTRVAQPNFRKPVVPHYKNPWGIYEP